MTSNQMDDEAIARMMQELEYVQSHHSQRNFDRNPPPTAPRLESFNYGGTGTAETSATSSSSMETDEDYARHVQDELHQEEFRGSLTPTNRDREVALKVEQELRDEEIARQLERQERNAASARRTSTRASTTGNTTGRSRPGRCRRFCLLAIPALVAIGVGVVLYLVFSGNADNIPFLGPRENDPFNGKNPEELAQWNNDGSGLELELVNALDTTWQEEFVVAMKDWENGDPDALSLFSSTVTHEERCVPVRGTMKVCNGDYGETGWRGLNQLSIQNGWIVESVAKVNEYYLRKAGSGERQYVMCHEIGHGFGLPHTDENFGNKDLGNCLDYTNNFNENKHPDESNYMLLADLYGTFGNGRLRKSRRKLRQLEDKMGQTPSEITARSLEVAKSLEEGVPICQSPECVVLENNVFSQLLEFNAGEGNSVQVHLLKAGA